ncbi:CdiA family toxin C-terminal domain-containing protein [Pseudomonas sp. K1(2024)]|uniref:CdiA family toxin C-terminal domain-containing protein n=1 Tax=Pseudomonas boreofloridensis TaxID=3064348 RepID=A0ABV4Z9P0_9PSED|nr:CdiA family toxin C-terminal domain-containing protein [Pseudomonas sp. K13]MDO7902970.1 CdiA family toxin C-terminal domain-containing protein [Pseudomonas sp. K13]
MSFNPNIKSHLSSYDVLTQRKGISGTHNIDVFSQAATQNGAKIVSQTPGAVNGISEIKYQIPAYDRAGNVTGYKSEVFTKTVYDSKVFTDSKILDLGQQAAASGYNSAISQGLREYTAAAGGVKFRVYLDDKVVKNFFPEAN